MVMNGDGMVAIRVMILKLDEDDDGGGDGDVLGNRRLVPEHPPSPEASRLHALHRPRLPCLVARQVSRLMFFALFASVMCIVLVSRGSEVHSRAILYRGHPLLSCAGASKNPDAHAL